MNNKFSGAILAGTLLITATPSFAVAVGTEKSGKWNLIDQQISRVFQPDGISDKELSNPGGGKWALIDNAVTKEFIPDTDPGHKGPGGSWTLKDLAFDRQFVPDSASTAKVGTREVNRSLIADKVTTGANFTDRTKNYGAESTEYRNEYNKEELMGTDNYQSVSGSYAYTIQNFRIDNHKDKYIHHPFTSTFNYDETLKHNYSFSVTNEVTTRVSFKDALYGDSTYADLVEQVPDTVNSETPFAATGKKLSYSSALADEAPRVNSAAALKLAATGDDLEGPIHVVTAGAKQQRMIGDSVKRNDKLATATTENSQDKVLMSNTQVGGNASAKVTYSGIKEYKAQGLGTIQVSEKTTTVEERKDKVDKAYSDSVDKIKDTIEKLDNPSAKKVASLLDSIKDAYASAGNNQDKQDLLKQEVIQAITGSSLSADVRQSIQAILEGKTAAASTIAQSSTPSNTSKSTPSNNSGKTEIASNSSSGSSNAGNSVKQVSSNDRKDSQAETPKPAPADHSNWGNWGNWGNADRPSTAGRSNWSNSQKKVEPVAAPTKVAATPAPVPTPAPTPTPKPDPMVSLLQNLGYSNKDLANYLSLARSGGDPVAYLKKAASYIKNQQDLDAFNSVISEQIEDANKHFKLLTATALGAQKLSANAGFKFKRK